MLDQTKNNGSLHHPLLFEMIRSFVVLAHHLNLTRAVEELSSTRQTVRRHIEALEESMGGPLFQVVDRRYSLTPAGEKALPTAQLILSQGQLWLKGGLYDADGMTRLSYEAPDIAGGLYFHLQQQSLREIWTQPGGLQRESVRAWSRAGAQLDSEELDDVRPYWLVYRETPTGFICVEIGQESFYTQWWGKRIALSSIGQPLEQFPGGRDTARILEVPFREVQRTQGMRLDQVATRIPRERGGPTFPLVYQRLLLGGIFPDGSAALIVVIDRPEEIRISGLDNSYFDGMPSDVVLDY